MAPFPLEQLFPGSLAGCRFTPADPAALVDRLQQLQDMADRYAWLAEMHIVDFLVEDHWQKLPPTWCTYFDGEWQGSSEDLVALAAAAEPSNDHPVENQLGTGSWANCPTDLQTFVSHCRDLALDRRPQRTTTARSLPAHTNPKETTSAPEGLEAPPIDPRILSGMNPKKAVEVQQLAYLIARVAQQQGIHLVADVGAGQGYLSRVLVYQYDQAVLALDSNQIQTCGAERLQVRIDKAVGSAVRSNRSDVTAELPTVSGTVTEPERRLSDRDALQIVTLSGRPAYLRHVTCFIDQRSLARVEQEYVAEALTATAATPAADASDKASPTERAGTTDGRPWLICGLHACGNLTNVMLQWYTQSSAQCLVSVGCCYNLLGYTDDAFASPPPPASHPTAACGGGSANPSILLTESPNYPLSATLQARGAVLRVNALKLACQAPTRWGGANVATSVANFGRHFYRALLHYLMVDRALVQTTDPFPVVGRLPKSAFTDFPTYCRRALTRLGHGENGNVDAATAQRYYESMLPYATRMAVVWTLKALLAPCLEALIILDRCRYLVERGHEVTLLPLFDTIVSPRNMVIVARPWSRG
ncbi:hypothetical protein IWQ60_005489 [Tieghemiomyces parasiticus]|uniref:Methyltransferase domain-containing protein n=1 Tax=Tieghemiomyces parasiticus TaxID=78921 RepID=A0A9W8A6B1_9FUNG|nr:hypothetical protein IWQ60_005489 [Tieghemiomyces parasiticus]